MTLSKRVLLCEMKRCEQSRQRYGRLPGWLRFSTRESHFDSRQRERLQLGQVTSVRVNKIWLPQDISPDSVQFNIYFSNLSGGKLRETELKVEGMQGLFSIPALVFYAP